MPPRHGCMLLLACSPGGHFASHLPSQRSHELALFLGHSPELLAEPCEANALLSRTAPATVTHLLLLQKIRNPWRHRPFVEKLVQGDFQAAGYLFEGLDDRNRVPVLDARKEAAKQVSALLETSLEKSFCFARCAQAVSHNLIILDLLRSSRVAGRILYFYLPETPTAWVRFRSSDGSQAPAPPAAQTAGGRLALKGCSFTATPSCSGSRETGTRNAARACRAIRGAQRGLSQPTPGPPP